jgi:hypothetical protein
MKVPNFLRLAIVDESHFITACRHGMIHLTWWRLTVRLSREEFRRLVTLLQQAVDSTPPASLRDGEFQVTRRADDDSELRLAALVLLLPPREFDQLAAMAAEALDQLDRFLASGAWQQRPENEDAPPGFWQPTGHTPFSPN